MLLKGTQHLAKPALHVQSLSGTCHVARLPNKPHCLILIPAPPHLKVLQVLCVPGCNSWPTIPSAHSKLATVHWLEVAWAGSPCSLCFLSYADLLRGQMLRAEWCLQTSLHLHPSLPRAFSAFAWEVFKFTLFLFFFRFFLHLMPLSSPFPLTCGGN